MCGRYASSRSADELIEAFDIDRVDGDGSLEPYYNVAPTKDVFTVFTRVPRGGDPSPVRRLRVTRWGLVPSWANDVSIGSRLINARVETLAEKPAFRRAFAARRALLPADGYYEWYPTKRRTRSGRPVKQPFFIRPSDRSGIAMAGLYEIWRDDGVPVVDAPGSFVWSVAIITTRAEDSLGHIHDRMPMLVEPDRYADWLDPTTTDTTRLTDLLVPAAPGRLEAFPVSLEVNNVANNGAELVAPLPLEAVPDGPETLSMEEVPSPPGALF
jgi:putative SOS response-associated peptidase YedK